MTTLRLGFYWNKRKRKKESENLFPEYQSFLFEVEKHPGCKTLKAISAKMPNKMSVESNVQVAEWMKDLHDLASSGLWLVVWGKGKMENTEETE